MVINIIVIFAESGGLGDLADLAEVDDDEIEAMLLNDQEVEIKTRVWYEFNKDYLEEQRIKKEKEIMDRKNGVYKKTGSVSIVHTVVAILNCSICLIIITFSRGRNVPT